MPPPRLSDTGFSRINFLSVFFEFFVPFLGFSAIAFYILWQSNFYLGFLPNFIARRRWPWVRHPVLFEANLPWLCLALLFFLFLPIALLFFFSISMVVYVNEMVGITTLLIGISVLSALFALFRWKELGWHLDGLSLSLSLSLSPCQ
eukprot:TRINITY_DN11996_c0_g1_i1.p1 TRINITY_DN11996_c0_g1~~TRINITY_DN11996_c0_g1_i1.p1  ORF type:complete len:147 (+),score=22.49 TRINITY_DN11996_c0_g1_i1:93-533(+)